MLKKCQGELGEEVKRWQFAALRTSASGPEASRLTADTQKKCCRANQIKTSSPFQSFRFYSPDIWKQRNSLPRTQSQGFKNPLSRSSWTGRPLRGKVGSHSGPSGCLFVKAPGPSHYFWSQTKPLGGFFFLLQKMLGEIPREEVSPAPAGPAAPNPAAGSCPRAGTSPCLEQPQRLI